MLKQKESFYSPKGLSCEIIEKISRYKEEPKWMLEKRLEGFEIFKKMPLPNFGPDLSKIDFDNVCYFKPFLKTPVSSWEEVPSEIKQIYEKLELPEFEKRFLAGLVSQYESQIFYESLKRSFEKEGVIFCSTDEALRKYPQILKKYFMTDCVPLNDNKFAALHAAVWSGGSFIYVPKGVKVKSPLQSYFYIGSEGFGQFEHTLIVAEKNSSLTYIEGCTAPRYHNQSLHSAVVEIFAKEGATVNYITIQNWAENIYNLNTKRALVEKDAKVNWLTVSLGSAVSMVYPSSILLGENAKSSYKGFSIASRGEIKDTGARMLHKAKNTSSEISSRSLSLNGGKNTFRGVIKIDKEAKGAKAHMRCESLILDKDSASQAIPRLDIENPDCRVTHEAIAGKLEEEQLFYLFSRGLSEKEAEALLIHGFIEPIVEKLPIEYALELDRLIDLKLKDEREHTLSISNL